MYHFWPYPNNWPKVILSLICQTTENGEIILVGGINTFNAPVHLGESLRQRALFYGAQITLETKLAMTDLLFFSHRNWPKL